jgi:hypothetical protein
MHNLDHLVLADAKNTDSWRAWKGDWKRAFPLDVPMVPSSSIAVAADGEHLTCGGFSLGKTVCLGNFDFITDYFGPTHSAGTAVMGPTRSGASTPWQTMIEDSVEESSRRQVGRGALASPLVEGVAQGLCMLPSQPHYGWRTLWPLKP